MPAVNPEQCQEPTPARLERGGHRDVHPRHRAPQPCRAGKVAVLLSGPLLAAVVLGSCGDDGRDSDGGNDADAPADRQAEIAERGAGVMPFDLEATLHRFEPTGDGLVQEVVADNPEDDEQITLIRQHLSEEATRFEAGDFSDPESIHGDDMPGLAELEAGADAIEVELDELPDGARITYTTGAPDLVDALHQWGEAQVTDHGNHAEHADDRED